LCTPNQKRQKELENGNEMVDLIEIEDIV